jgi:hypothetical protein
MLLTAALVVGVMFLAAPTYGDPIAPPQQCGDVANPCPADPNFDPTADSGPSPGAMFGLFAVLALVVGGVGLYWRVSAARRIAEQAGLDPDTAVSTALLNHDGLAATYLAANLGRANLRSDEEPAVRSAPLSTNPTERRLTELKRLRDQDLISEDEYADRRKAILDTV